MAPTTMKLPTEEPRVDLENRSTTLTKTLQEMPQETTLNSPQDPSYLESAGSTDDSWQIYVFVSIASVFGIIWIVGILYCVRRKMRKSPVKYSPQCAKSIDEFIITYILFICVFCRKK